MSDQRTTTERVLENYNSNLDRREAIDPLSQRMRFRSYARSLRCRLPNRRRDAVLDVGCGEGAFLSFLAASFVAGGRGA